MSEEPRPVDRWELLIAYLMDEGYADDEIKDYFDQLVRRDKRGQWMMANLAGERIDWGFLRGRRLVEAMIAAARSARPEETSLGVAELPTEDQVRRERARRQASGEPAGYDALADHFHVHASTIRRRLGVLI